MGFPTKCLSDECKPEEKIFNCVFCIKNEEKRIKEGTICRCGKYKKEGYLNCYKCLQHENAMKSSFIFGFTDPNIETRILKWGKMVVNFGKHKGKTFYELMCNNRDYCEWFYNQEKSKPNPSILYKFIDEIKTMEDHTIGANYLDTLKEYF